MLNEGVRNVTKVILFHNRAPRTTYTVQYHQGKRG